MDKNYKTININGINLKIYRHKKNTRWYQTKNHFFLDANQVCGVIGKNFSTILSFIRAEEKRGEPVSYHDIEFLIEKNEPSGIKPVTIETATLYWLQWAVLGNWTAIKLCRGIITNPLYKIAKELFDSTDTREKVVRIINKNYDYSCKDDYWFPRTYQETKVS
ncbi:hypothetical protein F7734_04240 [Scytonema sp. UIC 10036]|uniref:hypothetical protein n=1 Tax=Scytonema sp. UIC 10036 TaxID=2304196 RepID=UPI0012DA52AB|nr:hypothetical protein [Scytonema sp. UIC 10036]MUG91730.1 hypothetical protein [Scytonema sp. UIC 10036]